MTAVVGLDLSLASTGLALVIDGELVEMGNVVTKGKKTDKHPEHMARIAVVCERINDHLADWSALHGDFDLAVIEAPSFGSKFGNPHERAGVWWKTYEHLWLAEVAIETIAPASRAKYITGNGKADKDAVLEAARLRWGTEIPNHDVADAAGMAFWGWELVAVG